MCNICKTVRKGNMTQDEALFKIGEAMAQNPENGDHLSELLDEVLGIDGDSPDPELEGEWERNNR